MEGTTLATLSASGALAIFVKTPGLSPVKTRLAATVGRPAAEEFHMLSAQAVAAVVRQAAVSRALQPYWATAEPESRKQLVWTGFPHVSQGTGGLGDRLAGVYDTLSRRHAFTIFLGADAPQLTPELLFEAIDKLELAAKHPGRQAFVIGRAADGGFYLFGGRGRLEAALWQVVRYSTATAAEELIAQVALRGPVHELPVLSDLDDAGDIPQILAEFPSGPLRLPEQQAVKDWLSSHRPLKT